MRGEKIVSIVDTLRSKAYHYILNESEKLGFVFPVYFYKVSDPVPDFVRKLTVKNAGYVYAVIPCGASIGVAGGFLKSELKKRGLDEEQVSQVLRLPGLLPGLGDPVREKDGLPRAVRQSGFEVKPEKICPAEAHTNKKR